MPPPQIHPRRAVALLAAGTVLLIAASVTVLLWEMRKRDLERSHLETASLGHMLREQTERTFESADQVLRGVQERMQTSYGNRLALDAAAVRLLLGSRALGAPQLDVLAIADAAGRVVNASRDDVVLADSIAGTAYFKAFAAGADGLVIDRPMRTAEGGWSLDMARPFADAHGAMRGVVVATLQVPRIEQFYGGLQLEYKRPIALYLEDGTLLASAPARDGLIGERAPEFAAGPPAGNDTQMQSSVHVAADGSRETFTLARAGTLPLLVSVTSAQARVLDSWREQAFSIALGAFLVCAFTIAAAVVLARELGREVRLATALRDANERYHRTVESLMDAVVGVDASHKITLFNPAAERMFGLPAKDAVGGPLQRLIPLNRRVMHGRHMDCFMERPQGAEGMQHNPDITGLRADGTEFPLESSLAHTFVDGRPEVTAVLRDVTERRRAERELHESNRQLRALSASLQDVREQERKRIAAELHDELGQQLTGLKLELSWCTTRVREARPPTIEQLDAMRRQLDGTIATVRRIATELRPRVLDDLAFGDALSWQAAEFSRRSGVAVDLQLPAADRVGDGATATALFRIVQESLTNILRHAQAKHVTVRLEEAEASLVLRVRDDGRGMQPAGAGGIGLVSMRERATALGGHLRVVSRAGQGTTVEVVLPLAAAPAREEAAA